MKKKIFLGLFVAVVIAGGLLILQKVTPVQKSDDQPQELNSESRKKVLFINSYHPGYKWSAGIIKGVLQVFKVSRNPDGNIDSDSGLVELKIINMDTKRNHSLKFIENAALKAKRVIEQWQPDLLITADDNAFNYLVQPYFKDAGLPVVFCGINAELSKYGAPYKNTTGMIEVALIEQLIDRLGVYAKGERIGFLAGDVFSAQKECEGYEKTLHTDIADFYVKNFAEWKAALLRLQDRVDLLLISNNAGIEGWNEIEAREFLAEKSTIPTGSTLEHMAPYALITVARIASEQGEWAAQKALEVLAGKAPAMIPVVPNKKAKIILNMKIAKKLKLKFSPELLEMASLIGVEKKKILYINSYHQGYEWSDGIEIGLIKALGVVPKTTSSREYRSPGIDLKIYRMDTKLNNTEAFKKSAALTAKSIIDSWRPDLLIISDDNAAKYLVAEYYKNSSLPILFCGINWDASVYGFPTGNITGMLEVKPVASCMERIKKYSHGERIGILSSDFLSAEKELVAMRKMLSWQITAEYVAKDFAAWKAAYLKLQNEVDILIFQNSEGIVNWDDDAAAAYVLANAVIPSCSFMKNTRRFVLYCYAILPEEQGWWCGKRALEIFKGRKISAIPMTTNKQSRLFLNMNIARKMGVTFSPELLEKANLVE
jgi:ABC-type uncharacterized transport system substrate-binding protein